MLKRLNENDRRVIGELLQLFREVDEKAEGFKGLTGVNCPPLCGVCCRDSKVEATAAEMLPLAAELWARGLAEEWLQKLEALPEGHERCVFFSPSQDAPDNGRCSVYELRPLICRLFGFFTIKDKYGSYVYGGCKIIKKEYPEKHQKAKELIEKGFKPSSMTDFSIRVSGISPDLGKKMLPINKAAKIALEKIGFGLEKKKAEG